MTGKETKPPLEYFEMIVLPRLGFPYSEIKKMTLAERSRFYTLLDTEGMHPINRQKDET